MLHIDDSLRERVLTNADCAAEHLAFIIKHAPEPVRIQLYCVLGDLGEITRAVQSATDPYVEAVERELLVSVFEEYTERDTLPPIDDGGLRGIILESDDGG